jgi:hypothetical protein
MSKRFPAVESAWMDLPKNTNACPRCPTSRDRPWHTRFPSRRLLLPSRRLPTSTVHGRHCVMLFPSTLPAVASSAKECSQALSLSVSEWARRGPASSSLTVWRARTTALRQGRGSTGRIPETKTESASYWRSTDSSLRMCSFSVATVCKERASPATTKLSGTNEEIV